MYKHERNNNANVYNDAHAYDDASAYTSHYANANANANAIYAIDNYDFYVLDNFKNHICNMSINFKIAITDFKVLPNVFCARFCVLSAVFVFYRFLCKNTLKNY